MTELSTVRFAGEADRNEIWRLFRQGHGENGLFPLDPPQVDWWLNRVLQPETVPAWDLGPRGVVGVIGEPSHLEALAFIIIGKLWYTKQRHLEEFLVYVDKDHRRSQHHKALIEWMKEQSGLTGLPLFTGILSVQPRTEAKVRLYERMLPKAGAFFCFDPITRGSTVVRVMH